MQTHRRGKKGRVVRSKTPEEEQDGKAATVSGGLRLLLSVDAAYATVLSEPNAICALKIEQRIALKDFLKGEARLCFSPDLLW